jgi:hypothetical protein
MKSLSLSAAVLVAALSLNTFAASPSPAPDKTTGAAQAAAHLKSQDVKQEQATGKASSLSKQKKAFLKKNPSLEKGH